MIRMSQIEDLCARIAREFRPQRVVLFGSYAGGRPTRDSDVDLLVVLPFRGRPARKAAEIRTRVRCRFPLDLLVRTPAQVRRRLAQNDSFLTDLLGKGWVLYEKADR